MEGEWRERGRWDEIKKEVVHKRGKEERRGRTWRGVEAKEVEGGEPDEERGMTKGRQRGQKRRDKAE